MVGRWFRNLQSHKSCIFFGWMVSHEACLTQENYMKMGWILAADASCLRDHVKRWIIFLHTNSTWHVWSMLMANLGSHGQVVCCSGTYLSWESACPEASLKNMWRAVPLCIPWTIGKERTIRCFEGKKEQLQSVKYSCLLYLYFWKDGNFVLDFLIC